MVFKLMQSAQKRWICIRGFHQLDNVIKGVKFIDGKVPSEKIVQTGSNQLNVNNQDAA